MKKLNIRIILFQLLGILFLINGILQLKLYTVAEKFVCATNHFQGIKSECWNRLFPTKLDFLNFWPSIYIWIFIGLLIGIVQISFLNWRNKLSSLNTIISAIIMYVLIRLKFFRDFVVPQLFNSGRAVFSDDFATQCLVGGLLFTLIGLTILWLGITPYSFRLKKKSRLIHNIQRIISYFELGKINTVQGIIDKKKYQK